MKKIVLGICIFLSSCDLFQKHQEIQKSDSVTKSETLQNIQSSDVSTQEKAKVPEIQGLLISYTSALEKDGMSIFENLEIRDNHSGRLIDSFSLLGWGPVQSRVSKDSILVIPHREDFTIKYFSQQGRIQKKSSCQFKDKNFGADQLKKLLADSKSSKVNLESLFYNLFELAKSGNSQAFNFFMNPTLEQTQILKKSDGAASLQPIRSVLSFMIVNGCQW